MDKKVITDKIVEKAADLILDVIRRREETRKTLKEGHRLVANPADNFKAMSHDQVVEEVKKVIDKTSKLSASVRKFIISGITKATMTVMSEETAEIDRQKFEEADNDPVLLANKEKEGVQVLESGLQLEFLKKGKGQAPTSQDVCNVTYKLRTTTSEEIIEENTCDMPVSGVIAGFKEALMNMVPGDHVIAHVPTKLAYGSQYRDDHIQPYTNLIFEITLNSIKSAAQEQG